MTCATRLALVDESIAAADQLLQFWEEQANLEAQAGEVDPDEWVWCVQTLGATLPMLRGEGRGEEALLLAERAVGCAGVYLGKHMSTATVLAQVAALLGLWDGLRDCGRDLEAELTVERICDILVTKVPSAVGKDLTWGWERWAENVGLMAEAARADVTTSDVAQRFAEIADDFAARAERD